MNGILHLLFNFMVFSKLAFNYWLLSTLLFTQLEVLCSAKDCPKRCSCEEQMNSLECSHLDMTRLPTSWPSHYQKIVLRNCSINTIEKNAFRRFQQLREIHIENCPDLDVIDKFAFKGLQKLRLISIKGNPRLKELYKASFSGIGNEHSMRIHIKYNGLERIRALSFKNANNLRELILEDKCFEVESSAFASISKVDFLTVKGACVINEKAFQNTSRVHNLSILDSSLDIKPKTFTELNHVNQIQLRDNRIGQIEVEAFAGLFTVGTAHLQSNQIGRILPRAFANAENLGSLVLSYNTVREALTSPDCLLNGAQKFVFTENTLHCSCEMRWIQFHEDQALLAENYCGREEAFKALTYYKPLGCPPLTTPIHEDHYQPPSTSTSHVPPASQKPIHVSQGNGEDPSLLLSQEYMNEMSRASSQLTSLLLLLSVCIVQRLQSHLFYTSMYIS